MLKNTLRMRVYHCPKCEKQTSHILVHNECVTHGQGLNRFFWCIGTFGLTEIIMKRHWECTKCGELVENLGVF